MSFLSDQAIPVAPNLKLSMVEDFDLRNFFQGHQAGIGCLTFREKSYLILIF
jgi:hypothetical protein